jgi:hypothetical protein
MMKKWRTILLKWYAIDVISPKNSWLIPPAQRFPGARSGIHWGFGWLVS